MRCHAAMRLLPYVAVDAPRDMMMMLLCCITLPFIDAYAYHIRGLPMRAGYYAASQFYAPVALIVAMALCYAKAIALCLYRRQRFYMLTAILRYDGLMIVLPVITRCDASYVSARALIRQRCSDEQE